MSTVEIFGSVSIAVVFSGEPQRSWDVHIRGQISRLEVDGVVGVRAHQYVLELH